MNEFLYHYRAIYLSNYDGDSLKLNISLGMGVWLHNQSVRLFGIDTPELRSQDEEEKQKAIAARDFVRRRIPEKSSLFIKTHKDKSGKYGRLLATIFLNSGENLNRLLVDQGFAAEKNF